MVYFFLILFSITSTFAQTVESEIEELKVKVKELSEISNEQSEIIKRQLKDLHYDQSSRGYVELKMGLSQTNPDDIEELNERSFNNQNHAGWETFGHGKIVELEIGKAVLINEQLKAEIGIGYQYLTSSIEGSFTQSGNIVTVREKIQVHTLLARTSVLFKTPQVPRFYFGPGMTVGFSPATKLKVELEEGNEGSQVTGEGDSLLVEVFGKAKYEISRYFSVVFVGGYRIQEAKSLRLNSADVTTLRTNLDLDVSGLYSSVGLSVNF